MGWGCRLQGRMMRQTKKIQMTEENWLHREQKGGRCVCPSNPQRTPWNLSYFWSRTIAVWPPRLQAALQLLWLIINEPELCTIKRFLISIFSLFKFRYLKKKIVSAPQCARSPPHQLHTGLHQSPSVFNQQFHLNFSAFHQKEATSYGNHPHMEPPVIPTMCDGYHSLSF